MTESHDDECEAEFVSGAYSWTGCRCAERLHDDDLCNDPDCGAHPPDAA